MGDGERLRPCARCGWRHGDATCPACGLAAVPPTPGAHASEAPPANAGPRAEDYPDLKIAFQAWSAKDWPRMMGPCIAAAGAGQASITKRPLGPAWAFPVGAAGVFVWIHAERATLHVDAPMIRVPVARRVQLFYTLLDLNRERTELARFCLRDRIVVISFSERLQHAAPPMIVAAIRAVAALANRYGEVLASAYQAEPLAPAPGTRSLDWATIGEPVALGAGALDTPLAVLPEDALLPALELDEEEPVEAPSLPEGSADVAFEVPPADAISPERAELCDFLARGLQWIEQARVAGSDAAALERAVVLVAHDRHRGTCPEATSLLLGRLVAQLTLGAGSKVRGLLDRMSSGVGGQSSGLEAALREVLDKRGDVGAQPEASLPKLKEPGEVKGLAAALLGGVKKLPEAPELRELAAVGALLEVLGRGLIAERIAMRLRGEVDAARAGDGSHAKRLEQILERVAQ